MYSQKEPRVAELELGSSGLKSKNFGCLAIDIVNALNLAGWDVTPEGFFAKMNANGGFDSEGLLQWYKVQDLYPQFHFGEFGDGRVNCYFVKGSWGVYKHWVLEVDGVVYEPYYATNNLPNGWEELSRNRKASIDKKPVPAPEPAQKPEPQPQSEAPKIREYTVASGDNLWNIVKKEYGLSNNTDIANKLEEVKKANPELERGKNWNLIYPNDKVKLP